MDGCVQNRSRFAALCGVLGVVLLQALIAARAEGSCGDWLAHAGEMPAIDIRATDVEKKVPGRPATSNRARSNDSPMSQPCHGPFCRSAPSQPAPPAPANFFSQFEKLALFAKHGLDLSECKDHAFGREADAHPLRGFPILIEHPPRA
jgi:hypothetical protein